MLREVLTQKGNSPKYLLRSVNKEQTKYEKIFFFGVNLLLKKPCISLSCPGSWTAQKGTRSSAVMRSETKKDRSMFKIKVLLPKQYNVILVVKRSIKNKRKKMILNRSDNADISNEKIMRII